MESDNKSLYRLSNIPKPPQKRLFQKTVKVVSNHFDVDVSGLKMSQFYLYKVKFSPAISLDNRKLKNEILASIKKDEMDQCIGQYFCTGWVLFGEKLNEGVNIFEAKTNNKEYAIDIQIIKTKNGQPKKVDISDIQKKKAIVNEKEIIQFLNSIMKQSMKQVGYKDIGIISKYYDTKNEQFVNNCDLKVYKGFYVSIDLYQGQKFKLLVDLSTRVLQSRDCLTFMNSAKDKQDMENSVIGNSVIAQYGNNRTYYIDDIMYNMTPMHTFDCKGKTISYKEYYQKTYGLTIKQNKQPLLLSIKREKDCNQKVVERQIYLIPELVNMTGMTDQQRSNFKVMQELAKYTKMYPDQRIEGQDVLVDKISDNLNQNRLPIRLNDVNYIDSMVFTNPKIRTSKDIHPQNGDFKRDYRGAVLEPSKFNNWLVVYHQDNYNDAENFVNTMLQCGGAYGVQIRDPEYTEVKGKDVKAWVEYTREDFKYFKEPQIIVILLPNKGQDKIYNMMKELCHNELKVVCQCVRPRTLQKNTKSVCSNILLQMNAKRNNTLWKVERPNGLQQNTMIVGIDVHHGGVGKKKFSIVGFTATMDNDFTKYYSRISVQEKKDQEIISKGIVNLLAQSIEEYFKMNKKLPVQIIIFRDGVGDSMFHHVLEKELQQVEDCIKMMSQKIKGPYEPKLALIVVDKKIKDKFYVPNADPSRNQPMQSRGRAQRGQQKVQSAYSNCESGTIVDSQVVHTQYWQFFMVAQYVNQGTATPTRYILIQNNTDLNSDQIQQTAYFQCFNYYNWPGAVKVPAVVQYANNVAKHCGQVYKQAPQQKEPLNMAHWLYHL